jgi:predicted metalloprotease with PDZ domain
MNENYAKQGKFFADSSAVRDMAESMIHVDLREFFTNYVSGTEEIPWDKFFARVGLQVARTTLELPEPGFEAVQKFDQAPTVVQVESDSAAERAGLKSGDEIVRINGQPADRDFEKAIAKLGPGETLRLSLSRDAKQVELQWKLGSRKETIYRLQDVPGISQQQRERRAAWLFDREKKSQ